MSLWQTTALGALAGFTIYLGLPVARMGPQNRTTQNLLNSVAVGVLLFLIWDILSKAQDPIEKALTAATRSGYWSTFASLVLMFVLGLVIGLIGLVTFAEGARRRGRSRMRAGGDLRLGAPQLTLLVATGLGLHNFSEGLAIGQAASTGAIGFAVVLIVGFGLHNITEGFAVAAPMAAVGYTPSWAFLGAAGLIGGGPTFLGTLIGYRVASPQAFVLFLALAAGALFYVVGEMFAVGRRFEQAPVSAWGILAGFLAAYATDLILTIGGV
jgi:ZIP family zinc transporter